MLEKSDEAKYDNLALLNESVWSPEFARWHLLMHKLVFAMKQHFQRETEQLSAGMGKAANSWCQQAHQRMGK